jgi:hypothetical protein
MKQTYKEILASVEELGLLELYTLESRIKKEFQRRNDLLKKK